MVHLARRIVLIFVPVAGCFEGLAPQESRTEARSFDAEIVNVAAEVRSGDITIREDDDLDEVEVEATLFGDADVDVDAGDETLTVQEDCPEDSNSCGANLVIVLPRSEDARSLFARTENGNVTVQITDGSVAAFAGIGNIELEATELEAVRLEVETGTVETDIEGSESFIARVGVGPLRATFRDYVEELQIAVETGNIDIVVPEGEYELSLSADNGQVETTGIDDDRSRSSIDASTDNGNITVTGQAEDEDEE